MTLNYSSGLSCALRLGMCCLRPRLPACLGSFCLSEPGAQPQPFVINDATQVNTDQFVKGLVNQATVPILEGYRSIYLEAGWRSGGQRRHLLPYRCWQGQDDHPVNAAAHRPSITDPAAGIGVNSSGGTAGPDDDGLVAVPDDGTVLAVAVTGYVDHAPQVGSALTATPTCEGALVPP